MYRDAANPCSGAVALTFADLPQVLKNAITTIFECGSTSVKRTHIGRGLGSAISKCAGAIKIDGKIGGILSGLALEQITALAGSISNKDAATDTTSILKVIQSLDDSKYQADLQNAINDGVKLNALMNKITNDIIKDLRSKTITARRYHHRTLVRAKRTFILNLGTSAIDVKNNSRKSVKVKLTKTAARLVKGLKAVGQGDINVSITMKGQRTSGAKKAFNKAFNVNVGLN